MKSFDVHIGADKCHTEVGRNFVGRYAERPEEQQTVREPVRRCMDALWPFVASVKESVYTPEGAK